MVSYVHRRRKGTSESSLYVFSLFTFDHLVEFCKGTKCLKWAEKTGKTWEIEGIKKKAKNLKKLTNQIERTIKNQKVQKG